MHDDIAKIEQYPSIAGVAFYLSFFLVLLADVFLRGFGKRIQHTVAGAGADNEVICKRYNFFYINQDNIFAFFIFE